MPASQPDGRTHRLVKTQTSGAPLCLYLLAGADGWGQGAVGAASLHLCTLRSFKHGRRLEVTARQKGTESTLSEQVLVKRWALHVLQSGIGSYPCSDRIDPSDVTFTHTTDHSLTDESKLFKKKQFNLIFVVKREKKINLSSFIEDFFSPKMLILYITHNSHILQLSQYYFICFILFILLLEYSFG